MPPMPLTVVAAGCWLLLLAAAADGGRCWPPMPRLQPSSRHSCEALLPLPLPPPLPASSAEWRSNPELESKEKLGAAACLLQEKAAEPLHGKKVVYDDQVCRLPRVPCLGTGHFLPQGLQPPLAALLLAHGILSLTHFSLLVPLRVAEAPQGVGAAASSGGAP